MRIGILKGLLLVIGMISLMLQMNGKPAEAGMQCPNDIDNRPYGWSTTVGALPGPEDIDLNGNGVYDADPMVACFRVGVTDGYDRVGGEDMYLFGFTDLNGVPESEISSHKFGATLPAPLIEVKEGQTLYITETNLALGNRPDLFDSHTVHFHGYPHAMAIFDGVPESSIAVPPGRDFTYFYKLNDPGVFPYHCHFEPTEHIQLGMVGMIVVHPAQDGTASFPGTYVYNDGGLAPSTKYDKAYNLLIDDLDTSKHHNNETIQEAINDWHTYSPSHFTFNGRTYPDTTLADDDSSLTNGQGYIASKSSLITASSGDKILLRLASLGFKAHTLTIPGMQMHVVGEDANWLHGKTGLDLSLTKTTYEMAGGKTAEIILDTAGLASGTYYLYARELNQQSYLTLADRISHNPLAAENRGGMMTEIRIQ